MYVSDYMYGAINECSDNHLFGYAPGSLYYNDEVCTSNNYLFKSVNEWFISQFLGMLVSNERVFVVSETGGQGGDTVDTVKSVRPTLYLKPEVKITDGDGRSSNAYELSL